MQSNQSFAFIKTKKEIAMSKESFQTFVDTKNPALMAEMSKLPEFKINEDDSVNAYVSFADPDIAEEYPAHYEDKQKVFYLLCYLLNVRKGDTPLLTEFAKDFKALEDTPLFKVKMATVLFKSVDNKQFKKQLLLESIKLLSGGVSVNNLVSLLQTIDPILVELNFSDSELAQIYQRSIKSLEMLPLYLTIHLILKLLRLPADKLDKNQVERSLLYLIKNSTVNEQIVQLVQTTSNRTLNESLAFELFKLCLAGDIAGYSLLSSRRLADIKQLDLDIAQYQRKLKINSITKIASSNKVLSYEELAEKLQVPLDQVEYYIITAIQSSLISAHIDQVDQKVIIEEIKSKYFSPEEWTTILEDINKLINKLTKYIKK